MRAAGPSPDNQKTCPIGSHGVAPCVRENSRLAFRWRPRPDLQLRGARKPHPIFDLEWRDGARGTHRLFFSYDTKLNCLWQEVETQTWTVSDTPAGTWVSSRNLTYVKVISIMVLLACDKWRILHRFLTHHIWPATTNWTQRMT